MEEKKYDVMDFRGIRKKIWGKKKFWKMKEHEI